MNYYNEFDPKAAAWLRALIAEGLIPDGYVDERSIVDVRGSDLDGYTQCHFFAGIGGWAKALELASFPATRPVFTGSCPCQPFSVAGKGKGTDDERHLWPEFARLIRECEPPTVFGEQVASRAGRDWLAAVFADLEGMGYAVAGADLCAAGVGAPHIRQRLYWVADADYSKRRAINEHREDGRDGANGGREEAHSVAGTCGEVRRLADADYARLEGRGAVRQRADECATGPGGVAGRLADAGCIGIRSEEYRTVAAASSGMQGKDGERQRVWPDSGPSGATLDGGSSGANHGGWSSADWLGCRDGKWRPAQPGTFVLANGVPNRVAKLRGLGNAIVPQVAAAFIEAAA